MLELAKKQDDWLYPVLHLLVYTGIRRGELLALLWDAVGFENSEIHIRLSLARRSNGLNLSSPKTARGNRPVSLDAGTVEVLRRHQERQDIEKAALGDAYSDQGIVLVMSQRLGHANPTITLRTYAHVLPSWQEDAADDFARTMAESQQGGDGPVAGDGAIDNRAA